MQHTRGARSQSGQERREAVCWIDDVDGGLHATIETIRNDDMGCVAKFFYAGVVGQPNPYTLEVVQSLGQGAIWSLGEALP